MAIGAYHWYSQGLQKVIDGNIDLLNDTLQAVLLDENYTPDQDGHSVLADVSANEIGDADYARQALTTVAVNYDAVSGEVRVDWDNINFGDAVTIEAKYLVVIDDTHANDALLCLIDLNTDSVSATASSTNSDFDVNTHADGALKATRTAYSAGN